MFSSLVFRLVRKGTDFSSGATYRRFWTSSADVESSRKGATFLASDRSVRFAMPVLFLTGFAMPLERPNPSDFGVFGIKPFSFSNVSDFGRTTVSARDGWDLREAFLPMGSAAEEPSASERRRLVWSESSRSTC